MYAEKEMKGKVPFLVSLPELAIIMAMLHTQTQPVKLLIDMKPSDVKNGPNRLNNELVYKII